jgi:competence protein ComEC
VLDPVLLVALALASGAAVALSPLWAAGAIVVIVAILVRHGARPRALVAMLLFVGVSAARAHERLMDATELYTRTTALLSPPARCEGTAIVESAPVVLRRSGERAGNEARLDITLIDGRCGDRAIASPLRARVYGAPEDLVRGDRVDLVADLAATHLFANEGSTSAYARIARSGIAASGGVVEATRVARAPSLAGLVDRARAHVRHRIEATFHPEATALGRALVLGESDLDPDDDRVFRTSGLSHLLAVSGTHLVLAVLSFGAALRALLLRLPSLAARVDVGRIAAALMVPLAWLYADFAGASGSALRAAGMLSVVMLAKALGRRPSGLRGFAVALAGFALVDPLVACDVSFALSVAATAGLLGLSRPIEALLSRSRWLPKKLTTIVSATLAATLACAPLLATMAPTLPALGVVANVVAAPIGELFALPICLAHAALAFAPTLEQGAATLGSGALLAVRGVARASTSMPGALIAVPTPTDAQLAVITVAIVAIAALQKRRARVLAIAASLVALGLLEWHAVRAGEPEGLLRVTALDVGQGDSTLVDLPDGKLMLIDGGGFVGSPVDPGTRVILPVLRSRRRTQVDIVVLSHPHPDHFGGLVTALPELSVGEFWDTGQGEDEGAGSAYASLLASLRARGVPIVRPDALCERPRALGGASIEVLAPCPGFTPELGANDNSFVFRIRHGARAALFVGDSEHHEEEQLLRVHRSSLAADVLKVGHHGSRTSTSVEFLAAVNPSLALVSSGVRNRFGHPHPTTLATLAARGVNVARTDRGGAIEWETDGDTVDVRRPGTR